MVTWEFFAPLFDLFHYKGLFLLVYISVSFSWVSAFENAFSDTMHFFIYIQENIMFLVFNIWECGHLILFRCLFNPFHYKGLFVRVYISVSFSSVSACENAFSDTMHLFIYIQENIMFFLYLTFDVMVTSLFFALSFYLFQYKGLLYVFIYVWHFRAFQPAKTRFQTLCIYSNI
jgi:hypothetical protein